MYPLISMYSKIN